MMIGGMERRATEKTHLRWIPKQMIWKTLFNHGIFWAGNLCLMLRGVSVSISIIQRLAAGKFNFFRDLQVGDVEERNWT